MYQVCINTLRLGFIALCFLLMGADLDSKSPQLTLEQFEEGKEYRRLAVDVRGHPLVQELLLDNPDKTVVIEFFNYGCFGCMRLNPFIEKWLETKPESVVFYRFPLVFNKKWEVLARAYYINKLSAHTDLSSQDFFDAIFKARLELSNKKILGEFFTEHGIPSDEFAKLYDSFALNQEVSKAKDLASAYQVLVSPSLVVNKPYASFVITPEMVKGNNQSLMKIVNYLASS